MSTLESVKTPSNDEYYPLFDPLRLAAAMGIVWLHVAGGNRLLWSKALGRFAVPFYACSAVYFAVGAFRRHPEISVAQYASSRFKRLYFLFLVWSVFYFCARSFSSYFVERTGFLRITPIDFFWNGIAIQLWFLPFILCATIGAFLVAKAVNCSHNLRMPGVLVFSFAAASLALIHSPSIITKMGYTVQLGYETLPSCCAAIALGLFDDSPSNQDNSRALLIKLRLIAGIMLFVIWVIAALTVNRNIASENIAGFGLVLLSTSWRLGTHVNILVRLGALSFGIYLIHPLFVEGMQHILPKCGFAAGAPLIEVSIFFASLFVSTISVVLMRRWKGTRWLTG